MLTRENIPQEVMSAFNNNVTIGVAFVKADGAVRHMAFRKKLNSYIGSSADKSDAQINMANNNNLLTVVDTNTFIQFIKGGMDKALAASKSWRNIKMERVMAFKLKDRVFDFRDENEIKEKYGEEIYNSLSHGMIKAMEQQRLDAEYETDKMVTEPAVDEMYGMEVGSGFDQGAMGEGSWMETRAGAKGNVYEDIKRIREVMGMEASDNNFPEPTEESLGHIVKITYQTWNGDSTENGDFSDSGWVDEQGVSMEPDDYDSDEGITVIEKTVQFLADKGASEPSSSAFHSGIWYSDNPEMDQHSGEYEQRGYHLYGYAPDEEEKIFYEITKKLNEFGNLEREPWEDRDDPNGTNPDKVLRPIGVDEVKKTKKILVTEAQMEKIKRHLGLSGKKKILVTEQQMSIIVKHRLVELVKSKLK